MGSGRLFAHLGLPMKLVLSQVGGLMVVDGYGFSSPPFRGCRVLEVVVPYLRAVYAKSPSRDDNRPSSERCRERILVRLLVQCRDKALWGACEAVAGRCGVWRGLDDACAMCGAVGKRRHVIGRLCGGANAGYCGMWVKRSEV